MGAQAMKPEENIMIPAPFSPFASKLQGLIAEFGITFVLRKEGNHPLVLDVTSSTGHRDSVRVPVKIVEVVAYPPNKGQTNET
jgi:hypothetical protein